MAETGPGFLRFSETRDGEAESVTWQVAGESVAAIGFVARGAPAATGDRIASSRIASSRIDRAVAALMDAGSEPPPRSFDDEQGFVTTLRCRRHRGALALVEPLLSLDGSGVPTRVDFQVLDPRLGAGYLPDAEGEPEHNIGPAVDTERHRVRFGEDHVLVEHWQRYGLDNPLELEGRFDPDSPPPFAFISFSYRIYVDGRAEVSLAASYLPSCWYYRDWMRCHRRDMRQATPTEIEAALVPRRERAAGTTFAIIDVGRGVVRATKEAPP